MSSKHKQAPASLVVFSDDWGRHPSSCQHLVRQLLPQHKVLWVNTIGTRAPRLDLATFRRVIEKVNQWVSRPSANVDEAEHETGHRNLTVMNPRMWPWFGRPHDRKLNAWALARQLAPAIAQLPRPITAITTLPITADLPGLLPVDKWVYYCVDDFGQWPGLDGNTLRRMDETMIKRADEIVAVSEHLQQMISGFQRDSSLLTHGVDLEHWKAGTSSEEDSSVVPAEIDGPIAVFWGVVDKRLDTDMLKALSQKMSKGTILLIGPQQDPDEKIVQLPNVKLLGPQPFSSLPLFAKAADVLIMPYADLPVTRAMQPLKMKEYLATGRPVVASSLPAVGEWADCMDVAVTPEEFACFVLERLDGEIPAEHEVARQRLNSESWATKATQLKSSLLTGAEATESEEATS